jgi:hypothetical protein
MPDVMRRALLPVLLAPLACRAAGAPPPPPGYSGPAPTMSRGAPLTFTVRAPATAGRVMVRVAGAYETDADGLLSGPDGTWLEKPATAIGHGLVGWTVPRGSVLRRRPGRYYWQAYAEGEAAGPVQQFVVTLPAADRGRGRLYPRFGRRGANAFLVSSANLPPTVSAARFRRIAQTTASRWGLRATRGTTAVAGVQDGRSVAGFSPDLPAGVLGLETDYVRAGRVVERDLALNSAEDWAAGPDYPGLSQIDLESVLLHELGHMAGNKRHRPRCANSPMIKALGAGEWWRGARDHWFADCSGAARASSAGGTFARRMVPLR